MNTMRAAVVFAVLVSASLVGVAAAGAGDDSSLICPAPISTCGSDDPTQPSCPPGFDCVCVPSCPACRDCAARVCVEGGGGECQTACDCPTGRACVPLDQGGRFGSCLAQVVPIYCCEGEECPAGEGCQHRNGQFDRCAPTCIDQPWRCDPPGGADPECGEGRVCSCSASCPDCEDCGPGVCVPRDAPTPYRCNKDDTCDRSGDRCVCVSSCAACDDCVSRVCVPSCDPMCEKRLALVTRRIEMVVDHASACGRDADCARVDTSTGCMGTCGRWINGRYGARVRKFVSYLSGRYCESYSADGCPRITPRCAAEVGRCVKGRCTGVWRVP